MTGDRHRTNLRLMESALAADPELDKDINPYNLPELWLRDRKHCYMCDVQLSSLRMATIHFNSRDHRRAAGLRVSEASKNAEWLNEGDLHCDVCNFRVKTEIEMRTHEAGIRHLENEKTKLAVEGAGGTWSCSFPSPLPPPKYSVQDPGVGWTGESIGVSAEMVNMMDSMSGQAGFGGQNGWIPGQGPMGGHMGRNPMYPGPNGPAGGRGPPQWYHMQPQPQEHSFMNPKVIELRRYAGVDVSGLHCKCCDVRFTDKDQLEQHLELPDHMEKAKDIPHEELSYQAMNPEDYVPVPITGDSMSSVRTKQNSLHCPFCKVWFPSVTILIYYHSIREEHKENIARYVAEKQTEGEMLECQACRIKAATPEQLWDECIRLQKGKIFGRTRTYSCDKCDVHLSEIEWLQKHFQGEKHDYISKRVDQLLPVQWEPQEMVVVQKMDFDQFTYQYSYYPEWQCLVCKVGFAGIDKYKKHLTTLFHMRKCAGEPGLRFDPNNRPMKCLTRKQRAEVLAEAV